MELRLKKVNGLGPKIFGKSNLDKSKKDIVKKAIIDMEESIEINLIQEKKKNKNFDISVILTIISIGLIIAEECIKYFI